MLPSSSSSPSKGNGDRTLMPRQLAPAPLNSPLEFNSIVDVEFTNSNMRRFDYRSEKENGITVEMLTESHLTQDQYQNLWKFIHCVVDSIYSLTHRAALPAHCVSVRAALEHLPYGGGASRDTLRLQYAGATQVGQTGAMHLAQLWWLVSRRAHQLFFSQDLLPSNIALDLGYEGRAAAAIALVGGEAVGTFDLRAHLRAVGDVVELGEFHPDVPAEGSERQPQLQQGPAHQHYHYIPRS
ncbi:hypothetical protein F4810DRAFT_722125 [Camillea tinctor]|nr:hypothetical protein F4810DRAFT_722125 [Camillea tinctor]